MPGINEGALDDPSVGRVSRRSFLKLCAAMAAVLALPPAYAPRIAAAIAAAPRLPVIWLRGQGCGGDTEAFLRAADPSIAELLFDLLSVEYHPALMVASGRAAETALEATIRRYPQGYLAIVEGAIPTADEGVYLTTGGRPFGDLAREVCGSALATIAVGSCAFDGGLAGAAGGSTGADGLAGLVPDGRLVALPGCPVNVENLTATIVHYLTFGELPATDGRGRPLFAYGALIHNECGRRAHFEFGEFVEAWGDEGAQKGWCLYKMGCKGPQSFANCASVRYASGTSWPVRAGAACIACTMPDFWDAMSPFTRRLPSPIPFAPEVTVEQTGAALVAGVGVLVVAHGAATVARTQVGRRRAGRARGAQGEVAPGAPAETAPPAPEVEAPMDATAPEAEAEIPIELVVAEPEAPVEATEAEEPAERADVPAADDLASSEAPHDGRDA